MRVRVCVRLWGWVGGECRLKSDPRSDVLKEKPSPQLPLGSDVPSLLAHTQGNMTSGCTVVHVILFFFLTERLRGITRKGSWFFYRPPGKGWGLSEIKQCFYFPHSAVHFLNFVTHCLVQHRKVSNCSHTKPQLRGDALRLWSRPNCVHYTIANRSSQLFYYCTFRISASTINTHHWSYISPTRSRKISEKLHQRKSFLTV